MPQTISPNEIPSELIEQLRSADRIAVLAGAGLSAESGIPTFREAQTGLWAQHDPMTLASPEGFSTQPELVWNWYQWRRELVTRSHPNEGHEALTTLQRQRPNTVLITQNVDGLQQQAGGTGVLELHGSLMRDICSITRAPIEPAWLQSQDETPPPSPHHPNGLARPDVVWFGEALDANVLQQALNASQDCDLMLVVGTSGLVHPAASLPEIARQAGAVLVEINPETTPLSALVDWRLPASASAALPRLVEMI